MKRFESFYTYLVWAMLFGLGLLSHAQADDTRATYPESVNIEMLGRGVEYSVQLERMATEDIGGGIGLGSVGSRYILADGSTVGGGPTSLAIPFYVNVYLAREANSFFVTGGGTVITSSSVQGLKANVSSLTFPNEAVIGDFGVGFESRSDNGFLLRITGYGLVGANVAPWGGLTLGYAF